jgi:hypothetical protein
MPESLARVAGGFALVALAVVGIAFAVSGQPRGPVAPDTAAIAEATPAPTTEAIAPAPVTAPAVASAAATPTPSTVAYKGLGAWIDIWDAEAFEHPEATVKDLAGHGVKTIFIETSNTDRTYAIIRPDRMRRIIRAAHARKMKVVAWYLPTFEHTTRDYGRIAKALAFRTSDGQRFDGFALDIESSKVKPASTRNARLLSLSRKIRAKAGPKYPLGAIIPSPVGIQTNKKYWPGFPYGELAAIYDAFVPMSYFTYHGDGADAAYLDTANNVAIFRAQSGCASETLHLAGGIASKSSAAEVAAFVRAAEETSVVGVSLYDWASMKQSHWDALAQFRR